MELREEVAAYLLLLMSSQACCEHVNGSYLMLSESVVEKDKRPCSCKCVAFEHHQHPVHAVSKRYRACLWRVNAGKGAYMSAKTL